MLRSGRRLRAGKHVTDHCHRSSLDQRFDVGYRQCRPQVPLTTHFKLAFRTAVALWISSFIETGQGTALGRSRSLLAWPRFTAPGLSRVFEIVTVKR